MKKFNFQYNNVLQFKKQNEDSVKSRLSNAMVELEEEQQRLIELKLNETNCYDHMNKLVLKGTQVAQLQNYDTFILKLNKKMDFHKDTITKQNNQIDRIRQELINASKEVKVFEKLKENYQVEYQHLENKEEESLADQLVTYKSFRSK